MIEIAVGIACLIVAGVVASGLIAPWVPAPLSLGLLIIVAATGLLLTADGALRQIGRRGKISVYWHRTVRLLMCFLVVLSVAAIAIPAFIGPFGLIEISGFPLGFYMTNEVSLILIVIFAFLFSRRQSAIDFDEASRGAGPDA